MEELKSVIAKNIVELRRSSGFTQAELAEKLNYSDKAVSKWERGESLPDISVLKEIAELFNVKVDYLLNEEHTDSNDDMRRFTRRGRRNRMFITGIAVLLVWLVATVLFVNVDLFNAFSQHWLVFVYAVPASFIVWLVFNSIWFNRRNNFPIISFLMWSTLAALYLTFLKHNIWLIFILAVPSQLIILLWSGLRIKPNKRAKKRNK